MQQYTFTVASHVCCKEMKGREAKIEICPSCPSKSEETKKWRQWADKSVVAALEAVKQGEPIAAQTYGVPRSIPQDRVHGRVTRGVQLGPRPYLAPAEEEELSMFIVDVVKAGYGKTRTAIAENITTEKGTIQSKKESNGWFNRLIDAKK